MKFKKIFGIVFVALLIAGCGSDNDSSSTSAGNDETIQLGNPPELALTPEEYLPGDQLFEEGDPEYYRKGVPYVTAEIEQEMRDLLDHPAIAILREKLNNDEDHPFPEEYLGEDRLEKALYLDNEGRKQISDKFYSEVIEGYFAFMNSHRKPEEERDIHKYLTEDEREVVFDFVGKLGNIYLDDYWNQNHARIDAMSITATEALKQFEDAEKEAIK